MPISSILFDLDGVLVDACEWHREALNKALLEISGFEITEAEHHSTFNGLPTKKKLDLLIQQGRVNLLDRQAVWDKKQTYTKESIIANARPDLEKIEMHKFIKSINVNIACITNSIRETAKLMLESTGQFQFIDLLVSNEQVRHPKPNSEGYIYGMVYFESFPNETLIVEDSDVGLTAARATGAYIWEVRNSNEVNLHNLKVLPNEIL